MAVLRSLMKILLNKSVLQRKFGHRRKILYKRNIVLHLFVFLSLYMFIYISLYTVIWSVSMFFFTMKVLITKKITSLQKCNIRHNVRPNIQCFTWISTKLCFLDTTEYSMKIFLYRWARGGEQRAEGPSRDGQERVQVNTLLCRQF